MAIGNRGITEGREEGVCVAIELYTYWGLFIFEPLVCYTFFLIIASFGLTGRFYTDFICIN